MNPKALVAITEKKKVFFNLKDADVARLCCMSTATYSRRRTHPFMFTLGEVNNIMKVLKFTDDEKKEVFL